MKILITGICGFVGSTLTRALLESTPGLQVTGIDNFIRPGSETNRAPLTKLGVKVLRGDIRFLRDLAKLPAVDWVIDAAANPSVLAGVDGKTSSRDLVDHNLLGTVNLLEFCKAHRAGFTLLSTSRVYAIKPLAELKVPQLFPLPPPAPQLLELPPAPPYIPTVPPPPAPPHGCCLSRSRKQNKFKP